ncbi:MAG: hypothetical protein KDL10_11250 [Kiritimatiellae bacterium]|nr:hypothetical protein [Kiritimatiellia bacterium]
MAKRGITFKALVIDALEQSLREEMAGFVLRDASAGYSGRAGRKISSGEINRAIDGLREPTGMP